MFDVRLGHGVGAAIGLLILFAIGFVYAGDRIEGPATVRDGDTIVVGNIPIRLQGVAAPEKHEPGGSEATGAMVKLVAGKTVTCNLTGERTHDRHVGICYVDGRDIGEMIIALGLARDCPRFSRGRYAAVEVNRALPLPHYCR